MQLSAIYRCKRSRGGGGGEGGGRGEGEGGGGGGRGRGVGREGGGGFDVILLYIAYTLLSRCLEIDMERAHAPPALLLSPSSNTLLREDKVGNNAIARSPRNTTKLSV
jgi:hypothetical protein